MSLEQNGANGVISKIFQAYQGNNVIFSIDSDHNLTPVPLPITAGEDFFSTARDHIAAQPGQVHALAGEWPDGELRAALTVSANSANDGAEKLWTILGNKENVTSSSPGNGHKCVLVSCTMNLAP
ncbi:MAG: hypothetical protein R3E13_10605 [Alphaproteobacteria bacterium]